MIKRTLLLLSRISFALTVILIPFRLRTIALARPYPSIFNEYTDFLLYALDIPFLATLIFWLLYLLLEQKKLLLGPVYVWVTLLALVAVGWLSMLQSWDQTLTAYHAMRLTMLLLFFFFTINEIRSLAWVVFPVAIQVLIQSVVAIGQSLLQHDLGLQFFGEHALDPLASSMSVLESGSMRFLRAYGLSDHPNILGGCLAIGLVILLVAFLRDQTRISRWMAGIIFIFGVIALLLTFSRSGWLAFFAGSLIVVGVEIKKRNIFSLKRIFILGIFCFVAALPFIYRNLTYLGGRFNAGDSYTENRVERGAIVERIYLYSSADQIFMKHPVWGVGLGASVIALKETYSFFRMPYQPPHFIPLLAGMETGFPGAILYALMTVLPWVLIFKLREGFFENPFLVAAFAALIGTTVIGLFDHYLWMLIPGCLLQWFIWGLFATAYDLKTI